jgi:hypothetical protein
MDDILARVFVVFLVVLYTGVALVFVGAGFRNLIWQPVRQKLWARRPEKSFHTIKTTSSGESPS